MKILIADDHGLIRDTLVAFLQSAGDFVVATAPDFNEAVRRIQADGPFDIVLLDLNMPGMKGLSGLDRARQMPGARRVALMSGAATREVAEQALASGAAGFVPKSLPAKSLINAIRFMAMGEQFAPIDFMTAEPVRHSHPMAMRLTEREMQVLEGLSEGKSNKEIARDLELSEPTVKLHMKTLFRKLDVGNRTQAALEARKAGLF